jgi:hypothetical protein
MVAQQTPEEESKLVVETQFRMIEAQSSLYGWASKMEDRGDYYAIYVRIAKPGGRVFILRLECDDYPRRPPLVHFVDPEGWEDAARKDRVASELYPMGSYLATGRGPYPVMCIRGHRDFYAGGWHAGWTIPPQPQDSLYQFVLNVRNAIHDVWT